MFRKQLASWLGRQNNSGKRTIKRKRCLAMEGLEQRITFDVNQPPVNSVPGAQTYGTNHTVEFGGANSIFTSDSDAGSQALRMTLFVNNGILSLDSTAGLTFRGGANNTRYLLFDGNQANINTALQGLKYVANDNVLSDTLTVDTHDLGHTGTGGAKVDRDFVSLTRVGVFPNQAPVNTVPGSQVYNSTDRTVTFGAGNGISTTDPDGFGQSLRITLFVNGGTISLSTTAGLTFRAGANNTRYLLFDGSEAAVNAAMSNMVYTANAGVTTDTLTLDTHDLGHGGSGGAKVDRDTISLIQAGTIINQAPFNTVPPAQTYSNDNRTVTFGAGNQIATNDPDVGSEKMRVTLFVNSGVINLGSTNGLVFQNGAPNTRYLLFDGTQANINNALFNMTYTANAGTTSDVLTVDVHDLGHTGSGGAKVDRDTVSLSLVPVGSSGGGSGEPGSRTRVSSPAASRTAESSDALFTQLAPQNVGDSAFRLLDLLASTNSGRARSAPKSAAGP